MERPRRLILIPAYDEEKTIKKVVTEALNVCEVCVIDDSSQDKTGEIAKSSCAKVIRPKHNLGYVLLFGAGHKTYVLQKVMPKGETRPAWSILPVY